MRGRNKFFLLILSEFKNVLSFIFLHSEKLSETRKLDGFVEYFNSKQIVKVLNLKRIQVFIIFYNIFHKA